MSTDRVETSRSRGPVPQGRGGDGSWLRVRQGDTLSSIAFHTGHRPRTIWDHPANARIKDRRRNPQVLLPGDWIFVPRTQLGSEQGATGQRHRFRLDGWRLELVLRILPSVLPIHRRTPAPDAGVPYVVTIGTRRLEGETEAGGLIRITDIAPDVDSGTLEIRGRVFRLRFGELDPEDEVSGEQARLNQLGYAAGRVDGETGQRTEMARSLFQALDACRGSQVRDRVKALHGD